MFTVLEYTGATILLALRDFLLPLLILPEALFTARMPFVIELVGAPLVIFGIGWYVLRQQ